MTTKQSFLIVVLAFFSMTNMEAQLLKNIKGKIGKSKKNIDYFEEEASGGPHYEKYKGKVVFSNSEIERTDPESNYITTYTLGDPLYVRSYLENSVANSVLQQLSEAGAKTKEINADTYHFKRDTRLSYRLYLDGELVGQTPHITNLEQDDKANLISLRATLNDNTSDNYFYESPYEEFTLKEELLVPGKHKLELRLVPIIDYGWPQNFDFKPIAVGEIEMIISGTVQVTEGECFPDEVYSDQKIKSEILAAYKGQGNNALKIILLSDWDIERAQYTDKVLRKVMLVAVVYKKDGNYFIDEYAIKRDFDGVNYSKYKRSNTYKGNLISSTHKISSSCKKYL